MPLTITSEGRNYREYYSKDKTNWGEGPWQHEPDKVQWVDEETGLDCLIVRSDLTGSLCGYVGVPEGHPLFGKHYDDASTDGGIQIHGDLTFSGLCQEGPEDRVVCHAPFDGRPDTVWWLGFDCGHASDYMPGMYRDLPDDNPAKPELLRWESARRQHTTYRDLAYVWREVEDLARQLAAVRHDRPPVTPDR